MVATQRSGDEAATKSYGITKPLSVAGPSKADLKRNLELEKVVFVFCFPMEICFAEQRFC